MNLMKEKESLKREFDCSMSNPIEEEKKIQFCPQSDLCPECGERIYREGGCPICISCGWSPCG